MKKQNRFIVAELWDFLKVRKRYWLLPTVIMLLLLAIFIIAVSSSGVPLYLYPLM
jgi:hypothetical protein